MFVNKENKFPCANATLRLPDRPRPSLLAEEPEIDVEIDEGDSEKKNRRFFVRKWRIHLMTS